MSGDTPTNSPYPAWLLGYGNYMFKARNVVFPILMVVILIGFKPVAPGGDVALDNVINWIGVGIALAGAVIRGVVVGMEYIKRGGLGRKVYADDLVTGGMFAHGRNPLYVGNLLIVLGTFVIHNSPWVYLIGGAFFIVTYIAIVGAEETFLLNKFGDQYRDYCDSTMRWGIKFKGLGNTLSEHVFNWRRVIVKEYTTDATAAVTILIVLGYEQIVRHGMSEAGGALACVAASLVGVGAATLAIRALKKSGRLKETQA